MQIIDITIPLSSKTPVWEGDRKIDIFQVANIEKGSDFNVSWMNMSVHAGTHIDAPRHLFSDGIAVDQIPIDKMIGTACLIQIPEDVREISAQVLLENGFQTDCKRLLIKTGNSRIWQTDPCSFHCEFSALTTDAADLIVKSNLWLVGIDYFSISPMSNLKPPHEILLGSEVVILENINLNNVGPGTYDLYCLPLKLVGTDGAPVRAVLVAP